MPSVLIKTYGCQMNERDSEQVASMFLAGGYELTSNEAEADIILINTCIIYFKSISITIPPYYVGITRCFVI